MFHLIFILLLSTIYIVGVDLLKEKEGKGQNVVGNDGKKDTINIEKNM